MLRPLFFCDRCALLEYRRPHRHACIEIPSGFSKERKLSREEAETSKELRVESGSKKKDMHALIGPAANNREAHTLQWAARARGRWAVAAKSCKIQNPGSVSVRPCFLLPCYVSHRTSVCVLWQTNFFCSEDLVYFVGIYRVEANIMWVLVLTGSKTLSFPALSLF